MIRLASDHDRLLAFLYMVRDHVDGPKVEDSVSSSCGVVVVDPCLAEVFGELDRVFVQVGVPWPEKVFVDGQFGEGYFEWPGGFRLKIDPETITIYRPLRTGLSIFTVPTETIFDLAATEGTHDATERYGS